MAWKTIKWLVTLIVLGVVALVIVIVVDVNNALKDVEKPASVTPAEFVRVKVGMRMIQVRRLLGKPTDNYVLDVRERCWDYGTLFSTGGMYSVCFHRGRVSDKSHTR